MITKEQAEKLVEKMTGHMNCTFDSKELDALTMVLTSDVVLKAFGRSLAYCRLVEHEMSQLNMADQNAAIEFTRGQGQIQGVNQLISGVLNLITIQDEEENPNVSS